jgi:site-specific DNA-methyltransferase (adenine-specific)
MRAPDWQSDCGRYRLYCGDCLDILPGLDASSIDLIATDPPYFKVKGEEWDRQWDKPADFLAWLGSVADEWHRLLKPNGSLYCFASPRMAARVEVELSARFNVLNHIIWDKGELGRHAGSDKDTLRGYFPRTERIIFAEHYGADNIARGEAGYAAKCDGLRGFVFEPLRAYLASERQRAGLTREDVREFFAGRLGTKGKVSGHYFDRSQWMLPTREHYQWLRELFNCDGGDYLSRPYEELRAEYEELRRPFEVTPDVPYTDVWGFPTVQAYPGKHPCEKPLPMMEHIVNVSSREGGIVLDAFAGSGATIEAAVNLGREAIGIERDERYFAQMVQRIREALGEEVAGPDGMVQRKMFSQTGVVSAR